MAALLNARMHDGLRKFGELPLPVNWYAVRDQARRLPGASLTAFACDGITEAWIEFSCEGQVFSINDQFGAYWFFVADPACPETLLRAILEHFEQLRC